MVSKEAIQVGSDFPEARDGLGSSCAAELIEGMCSIGVSILSYSPAFLVSS